MPFHLEQCLTTCSESYIFISSLCIALRPHIPHAVPVVKWNIFSTLNLLKKLEGFTDTDVPRNLCSSKAVKWHCPRRPDVLRVPSCDVREPIASELEDGSWNCIINTICAQLLAAWGHNKVEEMLKRERWKTSLNRALNCSSDGLRVLCIPAQFLLCIVTNTCGFFECVHTGEHAIVFSYDLEIRRWTAR